MPAGDDFAAWFRLLETPGLGRDTARRLLAACGSPQAVLRAPAATLRQVVGRTLADAVGQEPPEFAARLAAATRWLAAGPDRHVLTVDETGYPPALLQSPDPPLLLYVQGHVDTLSARSLALVGSRHASAQGLANARAFASALGTQGWVVVSGLALGIDGAAHEGALDAAAGTVAVLGTGLDIIYPAQHKELARRIAGHGALVSEFAPGTPPLAANFPQRNRIIAGLSRGTLVVEAALRSGSLITARLALEAGREVFAVPGSIHAPQSKGCHALIKQGAKLVESAEDMLEEFGAARPPAPATGANPPGGETDPLLDALGHDPTTMDALLARTGLPVSALSARLLELELEGRVNRLPGGLFQQGGRG